MCAADLVYVGADHPGAKLMENLEGGFVAAEAKLSLELGGRHAWRHAGDKIGTPKPCQQRGMTVLHHGSGREPRLLAAFATPQNMRTSRDSRRGSGGSASRANESIDPANFLPIGTTGRIVGK